MEANNRFKQEIDKFVDKHMLIPIDQLDVIGKSETLKLCFESVHKTRLLHHAFRKLKENARNCSEMKSESDSEMYVLGTSKIIVKVYII